MFGVVFSLSANFNTKTPKEEKERKKMWIEETKEVKMVYKLIPLSKNGGAIKKLHYIVVDGKKIGPNDFR